MATGKYTIEGNEGKYPCVSVRQVKTVHPETLSAKTSWLHRLGINLFIPSIGNTTNIEVLNATLLVTKAKLAEARLAHEGDD